ncbi:MAG: ABC transporter ATP-binding protein [Burkholderiaceae bacterium]
MDAEPGTSRQDAGGIRGRGLFGYFEKWLPAFPDSEPAVPPRGLIAFIRAGATGAHGAVFAMMVATAIMAAFEATLFALLGRLVDSMTGTTPPAWWSTHGTTVAWIGVALVASIGVVALQTIIKHQTIAINLPMRLRWIFHRLLLRQPMEFYQDEFAGRLTTKVMQTALAVRDAIIVVADVLVTMAVYVVTMIVAAGTFANGLIWPFLAWVVLYIAQLAWFVPRLAAVGRAQADARALMTGRVTDAYTNITTVKLFSHARGEAAYARQAMREFMVPGYSQMRLVSLFEISNHTLSLGLTAGLAGTALGLWTHGAVGPGAVAAATAMALRLQGMSHWIMWEATSLFENIGTIQDGIGTMSRQPTVVDAPGAAPLVVPRGEIRFERVTFRYRPDGPAVIDDLSLVVRAGERIGLVGRSGAGKSTLVNLLLRFYDVEHGRIRIDGQDIAGVTQQSLRAQIGMVTQDTSLLHRSVADNIAYGRPEAPTAQVAAAANRAQADDFIAQLSDPKGRRGMLAHVGERGVKLSGGQRQRIAIARVMLKDAPILLLDEATSALDSDVEAAIQQSLDALMQGKTVIAIAHRLSTIAAMDRLVVIDDGRIVESGDHETLLGNDGLYARLWAHQSGGFLGIEA